MKRLTALLLLLAGLAAGCASSPRPFNEPLLSIPELLASQDKYQGKIVYVQGFANSGSENHSLCPDPAPESKKDCLPLQIDFGPDEGAKIQWQAADGRPIELKGTFNKSTATLEHVTGAWLEDWK